MSASPATAIEAPDTYKVRIYTSRNVQEALRKEQARRQLRGERVTLLDIAAEWMEEIAKQKDDAAS